MIIKFGTQARKAYYLPRILRSEDWWCQGYSKPGAGSDLASLKTRAERAALSGIGAGAGLRRRAL